MNKQGIWITKLEADPTLRKAELIESFIDSRKWAVGTINDKQVLAAVHPETMVAYNADGSYGWTDDVLEGFVFERWARGMDL